ncbi:MAG: reverse transcriptase family protein [Lysobacterales bacterium]
MTSWRPQRYKVDARRAGQDPSTTNNAIAVAAITRTVSPSLPPVFTLRHLAYLSDVNYGFLRAVVSRTVEQPYRIFRIKKRPAQNGERRYRIIAVPNQNLLRVQRWIVDNILSVVRPSDASVAFSKGDTLHAAAAPHCGCRWVIKLDVCRFFESISEMLIYRVFTSLGYQPLVAFEFARLCTREFSVGTRHQNGRWRVRSRERSVISAYSSRTGLMGHLPQGAPTSPMLANLAMKELDEVIASIADRKGLIYTRYADDLTLSTVNPNFTRLQAQSVIKEVYAVLRTVGLTPNVAKARILSPGARKVVLGLLVDGAKPKLPRDFKARMRQHLYYLSRADFGPGVHAKRIGFASIVGLRNHLYGLAAFAAQIEPEYGTRCRLALDCVEWPL